MSLPTRSYTELRPCFGLWCHGRLERSLTCNRSPHRSRSISEWSAWSPTGNRLTTTSLNNNTFWKSKNSSKVNYCHGCVSKTVGVDAFRPCFPYIADLSTSYCSQIDECSHSEYMNFAWKEHNLNNLTSGEVYYSYMCKMRMLK